MSPRSVSSVRGVKGIHEGRIWIPALRVILVASAISIAVWPFSRIPSTRSLVVSKAETTNTTFLAAMTGQRSRCSRMCSTLTVRSNVRSGKALFTSPNTSIAYRGALRKSGSPKVTWRAPIATSADTSAMTVSSPVTRYRPS